MEDVKTDSNIDINKLINSQLIIWNDNVNSFPYVINLLVEIVKHTTQQAEQCALIIHIKSRCIVKSGSLDDLKIMKDLLTDAGLTVTIE